MTDQRREKDRVERETREIHRALEASGVFAAVGDDASEQRLWRDFDLASLAENRLGDTTDPKVLDEQRRNQWIETACEGPSEFPSQRVYDDCYWLLNGEGRVGTMAFAKSTLGRLMLRMSSFYVHPSERSRGLGTNAFRVLLDAAARSGRGVRLDTSWCWQRAVRWYLARGMWIHMWKDDLTFRGGASSGRPIIRISGHEATLSIAKDGTEVALVHAKRDGTILQFEETDEARALRDDARFDTAAYHATSTLAVAIAVAGWPLVRSQKHWDEHFWADGGPPEALARRITIWEAWNVKHGWRSDAPRIPGLAYPTWDELTSRVR